MNIIKQVQSLNFKRLDIFEKHLEVPEIMGTGGRVIPFLEQRDHTVLAGVLAGVCLACVRRMDGCCCALLNLNTK
jgi:hypothetical protein